MNAPQIRNSYLRFRQGNYYFRIRIPADLLDSFGSTEITFSLRTSSIRTAESRARFYADELSAEFSLMRWRRKDTVLKRYLLRSSNQLDSSSAPLLSEAAAIYYSMKGVKKPKAFKNSLDRSVRYLVEAIGDKHLDLLTRDDANAYRDSLLARGLSVESAKRAISVIRAMVNFVAREKDLTEITVFASIFFVETDDAAERRQPYPIDVIRSIQRECRYLDDQSRHIIALISDTGMRLSEAIGLCVDDFVLDTGTPHLVVEPKQWRRLKTPSSQRLIPLVGESLWAAHQAVSNSTSDYVFSKYCDGSNTNSNSASAALNKWLRSRSPSGCVIHSFRHSLRDRLRAVECPSEIIDAIGGWSRAGIGEKYGEGYPMDVLHKWMRKIELGAR